MTIRNVDNVVDWVADMLGLETTWREAGYAKLRKELFEKVRNHLLNHKESQLIVKGNAKRAGSPPSKCPQESRAIGGRQSMAKNEETCGCIPVL